MKAISLTQPWATLVVSGRKTIETRSWRPPEAAIGQRIAIHAAKAMGPGPEELAREWGLDPDELPRGAVVGFATIAGVDRTEDVRHTVDVDELLFGDFSTGRWGWHLTHPTETDPIPARGEAIDVTEEPPAIGRGSAIRALGLWAYRARPRSQRGSTIEGDSKPEGWEPEQSDGCWPGACLCGYVEIVHAARRVLDRPCCGEVLHPLVSRR